MNKLLHIAKRRFRINISQLQEATKYPGSTGSFFTQDLTVHTKSATMSTYRVLSNEGDVIVKGSEPKVCFDLI